MMHAENQEQVDRIHCAIYGFTKDESPICIQLEKLDRYIQQHGGKTFRPETFDTFDYV